MTTQETAKSSEPPTFAEIREIFADVGRKNRELAAQMVENDARAKKREAKAEREMEALRKRQEATDRQIAETGRQLKKTESHFTSQWGKLMESLVDGDLVPLLNGRGIAVEHTHQRREGRRNGEHFEFDIVAVNRRDVVVVEVKTTPRSEDVTRFLAKLAKFTDFAHEYRGKRILGAVAYLKSDGDVTTYAERKGLFVIRATGSSASIVNAEDFEPRSFG
ncbi:MAG: hypothetical protein OXU63_11550 [Acidobacteriota bacterium]|nr:hypothetical protein [Acidobacteriota bacterium]